MENSADAPSTDSDKVDIDFTTSAGFSSFLVSLNVSLAVSTYQTGSIFLIGPDNNDKLAIEVIKWKRPMGLCVTKDGFYAGGKYQIWRFNNILPPGAKHRNHDRFYVPQIGWTTGDLDIHDIVVERSGRVVFVNTLYSCLSEVSAEHSFNPIWQPPNIDSLLPEDHCHLNGLTLRDGKIAYATAFARTKTLQGWREEKANGGVLWDIQKNQPLLEKLSMPHSPRWFGERLWLLESGTGSFGSLNTWSKKFESLITLPGYLRGLSFHGDYAFIGSSIPRENSGITHKPLDSSLAAKGQTIDCGVFIVNWRNGKLVHFLRISGGVQEIYDIAILPSTFKPGGVGFEDEDIEFVLNIGPGETKTKK
jgi:uncharacterized protein (TIGR03032 family)